MTTAIDPRYPIGKYQPQPFSEKQLSDWQNDIKVSSSINGKCDFKP
jgi:hypothetical protein